jgi:DNA-binding FadR family transcriptional regulator
MGLTFTKMVPLKSYQHVVEQIQSAIFDGKLREGDKLPSEMKLKELFNTSRGTVREALRILEQKGLVTIKTGVKGGATVKEANADAMRDGMALLIRHQKVSLQHLAEFREFLEGWAAEKAAASGDRMAIRDLKDIIGRIQAHIDTGPEDFSEFHRLDAMFHRRIAEMAGNPLIQANLASVHENIHVYFNTYLPFSFELLKEDFQDLCDIAEAVARGDNEAAGIAARRHVAKFTKLMEVAQADSI